MNSPSTTLLPQVEQQLNSLAPMALADEPSLNSINRQALAAGGGRKRAALTLDLSIGLGLSQADAVCLASAVETLHQASLVHDDLQDQDAQRRGQQAVWSEHGGAVAICLGDALIAEAFEQLSEFSNPTVLPALIRAASRAVSTMSAGQALDCTRINGVSYATYEQVIRQKSGPLLALPFVLPMICAGTDADAIERVQKAAESIGIGYQLADDWEDRMQDHNKHLNGFWVLTEEHGQLADMELAKAFNQHVANALALGAEGPAPVQKAIVGLAQWLRERFPELSEAA